MGRATRLHGEGERLDVAEVLERLREKLGVTCSADELASAVDFELAGRRSFHQDALDNSPAAMIGLDCHGCIIYANQAAGRLIRRPCDQLVGESLNELFVDDDRPVVAAFRTDFLVQDMPVQVLKAEGGRVIHLLRGYGDVALPVEVALSRAGEDLIATLRDIGSRIALRTIIENMPGAITLFGPDLDMRACNGKLQQMLGFPDTLFANGLPSLETLLRYNAERGEYGSGDVEVLVAERLAQARNPVAHVFERARADGTTLEVRGAPLPGGGFVTIYTDVTARKQAEEALRASMAESERVRTHLHSVIEHLPQGVTVVDQALDIVVWNSAFTRLLDIPDSVMPPGQVVAYADAIGFVARRGDYGPGDPESHIHHRVELARAPSEHRFERVLPSGRIIEVFGRPMSDGGGFVTTYTDITEIRELIQRLEQSALHDPLTGLANRTKFSQRFDDENGRVVRSGKPMALVVIDLDHFKAVNDTFGHLVGDLVLKETARVLRNNVRQTDLVARFGGEEFVVLLPETELDGAMVVAEILRAAVAEHMVPVPGCPEGIRITATFGVAAMSREALLALDDFIEAADRAAYRGKHQGRNRVCCGE
jgi:diguanylate cyclase (GGDEF)-like protein/PAS domain S-box-containing protein